MKTEVSPQRTLEQDARQGVVCLSILSSPDQSLEGRTVVPSLGHLLIGRTDPEEKFSLFDGSALWISDTEVSYAHAALREHEESFYLYDLGSTNGTSVNGAPLEGPKLLNAGDEVRVGETVMKLLFDSSEEAQRLQRAYMASNQCPLTGAGNKTSLEYALGAEYSRASRHGRPISVCFFDIDHFKRVNDGEGLGHSAGDFVLRELVELLKGRLRPEDSVYRFGGEEFVILMPETVLEDAVGVAEELRASVESHAFVYGDGLRIPVTISMGVTTYQGVKDDEGLDESHHDLVDRADKLMYAAKQDGRNRVCSELPS